MKLFAIAICLAFIGLIVRAEAQGLTVTTAEPGFTQGQCVQTSPVSTVYTAPCPGRTKSISVGGSLTLANTDCGAVLTPGGQDTRPIVTLPASPPANCEFTFEPGTLGFYVDFNGQFAVLPGYEGNVSKWTIPQVPAFRTDSAAISLQFNGTNWEQPTFSSPIFQTAVQPTNAEQFTNGQVYFSWNGSTSQFQLCPRNGPGGIIVDGAMREVPQECLTLSRFPVTSASVNYFYAVRTAGDTLSVNSVVMDPSGKILIGFSNTVLGNVSDQVEITCNSIGGAMGANVRDTGKIVNTNGIELQNTTTIGGTYISGGTCIIVRLAASTTGHITANNGIEQMIGGTGHYTLVGMCYVGASQSVSDTPTARDCASWYNRKIKTCTNNFTTNHSTSSSNFAEPGSEIECEFVTWGTGDPIGESDRAWSISGMAMNSAGGGGAVVTAGFDGTTPEGEQTAILNPVSPAITGFPLSVRGSKAGLSEGKHFITLLAKTIQGGTATIYGTSQNVVTSLDIGIPQ